MITFSLNQTPKIAILRALQLGDMICSIPAIRSLRHAYPQAHITLWGLPWAASFVKRFNIYFDEFMHFPGYPGLPEQQFSSSKWLQFVEEVNDRQFDLILQMQGNGTVVNDMLQNFDYKHIAGFYCNDCFAPSELFIEYPEGISEVKKHIMLMQHLNIPSTGDQLKFFVTQEDINDFQKLALPVQPKKYVCIHPGSRGSWRQWPPVYFAALADYCIEQGLTVLITGTNDEALISREVMKYMKHFPINLTGKTSLGAVAVLIKNARLLISNCTGVSHIAAALETPSIVISMDGEPERWAPVNKELHKVFDWTHKQDFETILMETVEMIGAADSGVHKKLKEYLD